MPRACGSCLTLIDWSGSIYLLPQTVLTSYRLPAVEARALLGDLAADVRGFGSEPEDVALWLPPAVLEAGKIDLLQRLALLPLTALERVEALAREESVPGSGA